MSILKILCKYKTTRSFCFCMQHKQITISGVGNLAVEGCAKAGGHNDRAQRFFIHRIIPDNILQCQFTLYK